MISLRGMAPTEQALGGFPPQLQTGDYAEGWVWSPGPPASLLPRSVLELPGLTVQSGQQQSGGLPDVTTVHGEAAAVLCVGDGHTHPLHQGRQQHEGPVKQEREREGQAGRGRPPARML